MYKLTSDLDKEVLPGTNILISGPPLTGKRSLALDVLATGVEDGEGAIIVTTKDSATRVLEDFARRTEYEGRPVAVVDCVTRQQGVGEVREDKRIKYTSSPVDMTGIGIKFSEFIEEFYRDRGVEKNRVMVDSLSTLLQYSDLQTVFRFMHVFTGRVQSASALGVYVIDSTAHDDQTMNTLKQLFDGVLQVSEGPDGEPELSLSGLGR
jgi:KaiC/GvpD/RAD55 family RecA-like ATPase